MEVYHGSVTPTATATVTLPHYAYVVYPPIARLLAAIQEHCDVGGTIRPGVRTLAAWANYASAGKIAPLLAQLADDGWIAYDGTYGTITLLAASNGPIAEVDQVAEDDQADSELITASDRDHSERSVITRSDHRSPGVIDRPAITLSDRVRRRQSAIQGAITASDRFGGRMEDHDLVAAAEDHDSAAATKEKLPCAADSITRGDRLGSPVALLLAELGCDDTALAHEILASHPDLTTAQLGAQWALAQEKERSGYTDNARALLFGTLRKGGWLYGRAVERTVAASDLPPPPDDDQRAFSRAYHHAHALAPPGLAHTAMSELIYAILGGASDEQALDLLAQLQAGGGP
jgi:hypothetical protein